MKNIILIIGLILSLYSCKAQTLVYNMTTAESKNITTNNCYIKDIDNHHDYIVGVWRWESGSDSFEMTLQEFEMYHYPITSTWYTDQIFGKYTYEENNSVITQIDTIETLPNISISLDYISPSEYIILIYDPVSERSKKGTFTLTTPTTATVELYEMDGVKLNYGNGQDYALPTSMTLTKQ